MKNYHYQIIIDLDTLDDKDRIQRVYDGNRTVTYTLDTNNKLDKNELLTIKTPDNGLIDIEITKITRYMFDLHDGDLVEMDMTYPYYQPNRPPNSTNEVWYSCEANALTK